jgi:hypothetical protein
MLAESGEEECVGPSSRAVVTHQQGDTAEPRQEPYKLPLLFGTMWGVRAAVESADRVVTAVGD